LYASQLIPTSSAQATFGGAVGYVFPTSVSSGTMPGAMLTGDLSAARSATSGALFLGSNGTNYFDFGISSAGSFSLTGGGLRVGGTVVGEQSGSTTQTYLPPVYTAAGAAVASTLHGAFYQTGAFSTGTPSQIGVTGYYSFTTSSVTLWSGAAAFSSSTSWSGAATTTNAFVYSLVVVPTSGTAASLTWIASGPTPTTPQISITAFGT
jgi:hypothetical protein